MNVKTTVTKGFQTGQRSRDYFGKTVGGEFVFDAERVLKYMSEKEAKALSLAGLYVMTTARGLIRSPGKKGDPAKEGAPPKSRTGLLRDFIDFLVEGPQHRVAIGPRLLTKPISRGVSPEALEHGGPTIGWAAEGMLWHGAAGRPLFGKQARRAARLLLKAHPTYEEEQEIEEEGYEFLSRGRKFAMDVKPHPYMSKALQKNTNKIIKFFAEAAQ